MTYAYIFQFDSFEVIVLGYESEKEAEATILREYSTYGPYTVVKIESPALIERELE